MYNYNCPDCNEAKLQSDKNARKINEVIDQVNELIQVNNVTVDFIEDKANEKVTEIAEVKVPEMISEALYDVNTEIDNINSSLDNTTSNIQTQINNLVLGAVGDGNNAEVVQARGKYSVLNDRLEYFE